MEKKHFKQSDLLNDPRISKAKELINETIAEYQAHYTDAISLPNKPIESQLKRFSKMRGGDLYFPYVSAGLGNGSKVLLIDGSVKLDFINGIGAHFGHQIPFIRDAAINAAIQDTIMQGNLQQNEQSFPGCLPCPFLCTFLTRLFKSKTLMHVVDLRRPKFS